MKSKIDEIIKEKKLVEKSKQVMAYTILVILIASLFGAVFYYNLSDTPNKKGEPESDVVEGPSYQDMVKYMTGNELIYYCWSDRENDILFAQKEGTTMPEDGKLNINLSSVSNCSNLNQTFNLIEEDFYSLTEKVVEDNSTTKQESGSTAETVIEIR